MHSDTPVARERFAFLLWPDSNEAQARTNLRQLLHHLRRALPPECNLLESDNHSVRWRRDPACSVDVWDFDAAVAAEDFETAARLYQDDLLSAIYDDWLTPLRAQYRERLADLLEKLAARAEQRRDFPEAIRHAERLVAHDPLRESHHQILIRAYAAAGDRASALRAYHQCMRLLRRELGVEPGTATRELFEEILKTGGASGPATETPPTDTAPPLPLIGRKPERESLTRAWRTAESGPVQMAVILGEPGIGKSRLAEEVCTLCARAGGAVARTRCYAGQGEVAFAPIAEWLRSDPLRAARKLLSAQHARELARVLPEILEETSAPPPLADSRERLIFYESLNAAFGRAAKPLLLAIDDLQWCDADSFEWMHSLLRSPAASRILLLGTARADEIGRGHPLSRLLAELRQSGNLTEIALTPLDAHETAELAMQIAGGALSDAVMEELYRGTRGNPLFVVESVRAGMGSATPPRIHAVISARFSQLSKSAYELAGLAAAIGRSFSFDLLARATDWDEDSLNQALEELWQRRIVEGHGASEYDFTHDRLREVAYQELSLVRRRFLHRRLARVAEGPNAQAAHFEAAGMPEEAIHAYREAAALARQRYADAEAVASLRRAIALCRELPETAKRDQQELELLVNLGPALVTVQGYAMPEVGETYARALELSRQFRESPHLYGVLSGAWVYETVRGQMEKARELAEEFLRLAFTRSDEALKMVAHFVIGCSLFHRGRMSESLEQIQCALESYTGPSPSVLALFAGPDVGVFCRSYLSHLQWQLGSAEAAEQSSSDALDAASKVGHPFSMAIALVYRAMLRVFEHRSLEALAVSEEAIALCRKHQFVYYLAMAEILGGWARAMEGDREAGLLQLRQGMEALKATGAELRLPFYYGLLAEACAVLGERGEAMANLATAFAFQGKNAETWAATELERIQRSLESR